MVVARSPTGHHHRIWLFNSGDSLNKTLTYAIYDGSYIKIGRTEVHPRWRMHQLATGSSRPLQLLGYTSTISEKCAHRLLYSYRIRGEWFKASASVLGLLRSWDWLNVPLYRQLCVCMSFSPGESR